MLTRILNALGLTTAAQTAALQGRAEKLDARATGLHEQVQAARERERGLKSEVHERERDLERAQADAQRAERERAKLAERAEQLSAAKADVERLKAQVRELEHENTRLNAEIAGLEARLAEGRAKQEALSAQAEEQRLRADKGVHAARVAREQLMALEVKLDLVEAAIRVLDTRTRDADPAPRP